MDKLRKNVAGIAIGAKMIFVTLKGEAIRFFETLDYTENGIKAYEEKMRLQKERWLQKTATNFGMQLIYNVEVI